MSLATEIVAQFARIVRTDGGRLTILEDGEKAVRIGYVSGTDPNCDGGTCVLPPAELQMMMREWLARREPGATVTVQPASVTDAARASGQEGI